MRIQGQGRTTRRALGMVIGLALLLLITIAPAQAALQWSFSPFDASPSIIPCSSLALDSSGVPHIVYEVGSGTDTDVLYAVRDGGSWSVQTIATGILGGACSVSLALDSNDQPHVAFYDTRQEDLDYATLSAGTWNVETVDSVGDVGYFLSLALDSQGRPHISYADLSNDDLRYAVDNGSGWITTAVESDGVVGWFTSLALDSNDQPHIAYYDFTNRRVRYASWTGAQWEFQTVDTSIGPDPYISLKLDANDVPHISYGDENTDVLKYAVLSNGTWSVETVGANGFPVAVPSLALDASGVPHISYYGPEQDLKYAVQNGTSWDIQTVTANNAFLSSLALDDQGHARISYYDLTDGQFVYAEQVDDSIAPVTTASATTPGDTPYTFGDWTNQSVTVTLSATDSGGSGVAGTYDTLDGGDQQTYSAPFTISDEGAHTLRFWSVDNADNTETAQEKSVNIDLTPPTITIAGNQGSYTVDQSIDISCTASDQADLSGLASSDCQEISGAATDFGTGTHTYTFTATDNAGNMTTATVSFTISVTPDSLCSLTEQYDSNARSAQQLCAPLGMVQLAERMRNPGMKASAINSYILLVNTQRGRGLTNQQADTLIALAREL